MVFNIGLLDYESVSSPRKACSHNKPFPHIVIQDAIEDSFLREVRNEISAHLPFNFDENHVYRICRSTNLANLSNPDEFAPTLFPHLIQLRDAIYSYEFRKWVSTITGTGPLSGTRSSMAVNMYIPGGHLLVHDDCNPGSKSRRVSYILYLTNPDNPWQAEWGGNLKLYANEPKVSANGSQAKVTLSYPSKSIPPSFNQLALFTVKPGETYHEVEEVCYSGDAVVDRERHRVTVSGWLHAAQDGDEDYDEAFYRAEMQTVEHLHDIKASMQEFHEPQVMFMPISYPQATAPDDDGLMLQSDWSFLSHYLAPQLLEKGRLRTLASNFGQTSMLRLRPFLNEHFALELKQYITTFDQPSLEDHRFQRTQSEWKTARPPDAHRYLYFDGPMASQSHQSPVAQLLHHVLQSHAFIKWLAMMTGFTFSNFRGQHAIARRFRRGQDYILANGSGQGKLQIDYTVDMSPENSNYTNMYGENDSSGEEGYLASAEDTVDMMFAGRSLPLAQSDGCVYKSAMTWNQFGVLLRSGHMQSYVKYMSHAAIGDRWDIKGQLQLHDHVHGISTNA